MVCTLPSAGVDPDAGHAILKGRGYHRGYPLPSYSLEDRLNELNEIQTFYIKRYNREGF